MIFIQLAQQLISLKQLLESITNAQYTHTISHLGNASIGGHSRHIIELVQCAVTGYHNNEVDYINRKRNLELQTNRNLAVKTLDAIVDGLRLPDKVVRIVVDPVEGMTDVEVHSTYYREIVYNTEHTIHHLALIKVALIELGLDVVDADFGMAYSTIKYKQQLDSMFA